MVEIYRIRRSLVESENDGEKRTKNTYTENKNDNWKANENS